MTELEAKVRIEELEAAVRELREAIAQVPGRFGSMRQTHRCPACGGGSLLLVGAMKIVAPAGLLDHALVMVRSRWTGMITQSLGPLGAFVCRDCRLVEWYARSLDGVEPDGVNVIAVEAPPDPVAPGGGPYR